MEVEYHIFSSKTYIDHCNEVHLKQIESGDWLQCSSCLHYLPSLVSFVKHVKQCHIELIDQQHVERKRKRGIILTMPIAKAKATEVCEIDVNVSERLEN
jgi:hypothetical protein